MGFGTEDKENGNGGLPDISATIIDIGIDYREYDNGNDENRLVVLWKPDSDTFGIQTAILSTYNVLKVKPSPRIVRVGGSENGFDLEIIGDVIEEGVLGYKAAVWMNKLESLGVPIPSDSGDLRELIGTKAVLKQMTYREAKGNKRGEGEKPFWMPIEIIDQKEKPAQSDEVEVSTTPTLSLYDAVKAVAPGKSEKEIVDWYIDSDYIEEDNSVVPLYLMFDRLMKDGQLMAQNGIYVATGAGSGEQTETSTLSKGDVT